MIGQCTVISDDKNKTVNEIEERQELAENGKAYELIIHAEGGTTNGTMIKMKKGSFASLRSIRPRAIKYNNSLTIRPTSGIIDGLKLYIMISGVLPSTISVYDMPIFRPNEYFWANHL